MFIVNTNVNRFGRTLEVRVIAARGDLARAYPSLMRRVAARMQVRKKEGVTGRMKAVANGDRACVTRLVDVVRTGAHIT